MTTYFTLISTIILVAVIFLIFREAVNWYYKINERVELQKRTNQHLEKIIELLQEKK